MNNLISAHSEYYLIVLSQYRFSWCSFVELSAHYGLPSVFQERERVLFYLSWLWIFLLLHAWPPLPPQQNQVKKQIKIFCQWAWHIHLFSEAGFFWTYFVLGVDMAIKRSVKPKGITRACTWGEQKKFKWKKHNQNVFFPQTQWQSIHVSWTGVRLHYWLLDRDAQVKLETILRSSICWIKV